MNESDFEADLRAFRPAAPSSGLHQRVAHAMEEQSPRSTIAQPREPNGRSLLLSRIGWVLGSAGAAAAIVLTLVIPHANDRSTPKSRNLATSRPPAGLQEVATERALLEAAEEGFFCNDVEEPMRRLRLVFLERHTWSDAETGALISVEVPREDIFVVPVAMQ